MAKVVLGVTGGIAAFRSADIVRLLVKMDLEVQCVLTEHAAEFIAPLTLETLSGNAIESEMFRQADSYQIRHIRMAEEADVLAIAPATANFLAKAAHGIADDLLTTTVLVASCPVVAAPAMNNHMWENPATQENIRILKDRGWIFVGPAYGKLACGDIGPGKLSEPEEIVKAIGEALHPVRDLAGRKVVVTAGPTREKLDPVRYLTNNSSGKMGYALAMEASRRGADTVLISGPVRLEKPAGVRLVQIESTQELYEACLKEFAEADLFVMAAAPADYRPESAANQKIKKKAGEPMTLRLVENPDIAAAMGAKKREGQILVLFAAETNNLLGYAREKLLRKNGDLLVANDVTREGAGFDVDTNAVTLLSRDAPPEEWPLLPKTEVAGRILDAAAKLLS